MQFNQILDRNIICIQKEIQLRMNIFINVEQLLLDQEEN
jgi:hypothetical protein